MPATQQIRLLLWKDYLIRKRKWVSLGGIVWATAVVLTLYIVRINVNNQDFPTCQFPARALPSAGMLNFLQSFICTVNNECSDMDKFDEIPTYEGSKLTQLQRKFSPILYNETILDVAAAVPDALKLLSKLADIADEPTFIDITRNGLKVRDLFQNPNRAKRYISSQLSLTDDVTQNVLDSEISLQGVFKGNLNRCSATSVSELLVGVKNREHLEVLVNKLCSLSSKDVEIIAMELLTEVDFEKYIKMVGNMYYKLNGDARLGELGDTVTAVLHMTRLQSFMPQELLTARGDDDAFSYINLDLIRKLLNLFEPTFGDTEAFKSVKELSDMTISGLKYFSKFLAKLSKTEQDARNLDNTEKYQDGGRKTAMKTLESKMSSVINNAIAVFEEAVGNTSVDAFNILSQVTNFIYKWLPENQKHDVLLYSTLLTKLIECANQVIEINLNMEERAYNTSLRHPLAVKVLVGLPSYVVAKGFEALADAERTQIITSKVNTPGQMFCDIYRIQTFFKVSREDAATLKGSLCTEIWRNYVIDLVKTFGINEVKENINAMASILIQETFGKDISDQLYTIDRDFQVLKNFTQALTRIRGHSKAVDWIGLFNVSEDSSFMKTVRAKGFLGKQMLITIHGALAKEVVKQNLVLSYKISPALIDTTTLITGINRQLDSTARSVVETAKDMYPQILRTVLGTALDENKSYKSLSSHSEDILCNGVENASMYLQLPQNVDKERLVTTLCDVSVAIENGMKAKSEFVKAIAAIRNSKRPSTEVQWTTLITGLKDLYVKLESDYTYLFEYSSYGMDEEMKKSVNDMFEDSKRFWFGGDDLGRSLHISMKLGFRFLDLLDREMFNVTDVPWRKMKYVLNTVAGPIDVFNEFIHVVAGAFQNESVETTLPPTTVEALLTVIPNIPHLLVDAVDILITGNTEIEPIIALLNSEPPWPCTPGLAGLLPLSSGSAETITALESLLCMNEDDEVAWRKYMDQHHVTVFDLKKWNTTTLDPHVFLKFSTSFDELVNDTFLIKDILEEMTVDSNDGRVTWVFAWDIVMGIFKRSDRDSILEHFFMKLDTVLNSVNTTSDEISLYTLWYNYLHCNELDVCKVSGRVAWKHTLQFFSVMFQNAGEDLLTYFRENNESNSTLLQLFGFTSNTTLYEMYYKMPDLMGVLLNSYWDYGFMSQIRRASLSQFWDCEAVVNALVPPPGSRIDELMLHRVQPYVCPSFLYWISLPRGENKLLDVVAKPQYFFYTVHVQHLTSTYKEAYSKSVELANYLAELAEKNTTLTEEDVKMNTLQGKLETFVNTLVNFKINETDQSYRLFSEINKKQLSATIYLTKIVAVINKIAKDIENIQIKDSASDEDKKFDSELKVVQNVFKRKPSEAIAMHFDVITRMLWDNSNEFNIVSAIEDTCVDFKSNVSNDILVVDQRVKNQICSKNYKAIYSAIQNVPIEDYESAKGSLNYLVMILQDGDTENVTSIAEFLNQRKELMNSLKRSIKYAYEIGTPIYLKYLEMNIQHYDVIMTFLTGEDWWKHLRELYSGPYATFFFDSLERSLEVADDVLSHLDEFHFVKLLRDVNLNNTDAFCMTNITLSDYIPDNTAVMSELKRQLCDTEKVELFKELPPLLIASQGYDIELKLSKDTNYTSLQLLLSDSESKLDLIREGPSAPQRPSWVTDEQINRVKKVANGLLSKETMTRVSFGLLTNIVDAGTLFLNNSQCALCSRFTSWFKQINLQIFKKQEYDNLLCQIQDMDTSEVFNTLKHDFHWDMAIRELILNRNYTKFELNKSMNEFLELVKLHLLEDMSAGRTKLSECLAWNVTKNAFGNATLFISVLSHTSKLIRAQVLNLKEIDGVSELRYFKQLEADVAHKLDVFRPVKEYLSGNIKLELDEEPRKYIEEGEINLRLVSSPSEKNSRYLKLKGNSWEDICTANDCVEINNALRGKLNMTKVQEDVPKLQKIEFWRFEFIGNILQHMEELLSHTARLIGVASKVDVGGIMEGKLSALVDFMMDLLMEETLNSVLYSLQGLIEELHPLLEDTSLEHDVTALKKGLVIMDQFKNYLLENVDLKMNVSKSFPKADRIESGLMRLGINNTNFWSIAAPRIENIDLGPLFMDQEDFHINNYICQMDYMSQVLLLSQLDLVTADDVYGAVIEQFCDLGGEREKEMLAVVMGGVNFSAVIEKVTDLLLPQLFSSSNLTQAEGAAVMESYPQMAALLPVLQENIGELGEAVANEPLVQSLRDASSVGALFGSSSFMSNAGKMMCGKPFPSNDNRFYNAIAKSEDFSKEPDQEQLDVLPSDFCRSLYKDILSMDGGKIVWSFIKPLIMGKILYTPSSPIVERIMRTANSSFAHMIKLTGLIHSFSNSFSSVDSLSAHRNGMKALMTLITSPNFGDLKNMIIGDGEVPNVDVDGIFDEFGDVKGIGSLLQKASDLLQCINLNRFVAVPDEYQLTHEAVRLSRVNEFSAGIVFLNTEARGDSPLKVEYKIRMDIENAPTTARKKNYLWIPGPESSFIEHMRYFRGFIQIQDIIDKAVIDLSRPHRQKRELTDVGNYAVYTQQEPYPCYRKDFFQTSLYESQALIVAFFFSLLFTVSSAVRLHVSDKETGNTMLMSVMGVDLSNHTISWFVVSLVEMMATCVCITIVLIAGGILPNTDASLLFAMLTVFGVSVLAFCYMMSKFFKSASFAAVCTAIAYLVSFMPFVIILSLEAVITNAVKSIVCLSMSSAICYSFLHVTRFEAAGKGAHWGDIWSAPAGDYSIAAGALMAIFDAFLYFLIGYLTDRYFGPRSLQSSITNCVVTGEKAGVSIINVTKIYGARRPKLALDNVSIELHKGQITTLLGHNGAGKTTLINILTGMLKPTKGHITIRSDASGTGVGVCPQRDVLHDCLTAAEHISLYAQLKSQSNSEEVRHEVDSMLEVLSLGPFAHEQVSKLSGGTRRRLCVALAFVSRPHLVSLDEPTAGVDPAARRDIWEMIVKLREDRTILMTTHHLDEAELLSDQIVIMHKGQVHTTGSPIEIKRSLGSGYKLTVIYPAIWSEEEVAVTMEERSKQLLTVVRETIDNATLIDLNGLEVEMELPFFNSSGLNNNYLNLCSSLESRQSELGFRSYTMDCSSLEQVFFNICQQVDVPHRGIEYVSESPSKSTSTASIRSDQSPLVPAEGPVKGPARAQFLALLRARYIHYTRNRWLLFLLIVLPALFVTLAMAFSLIRPPPDNEVSLRLHPDLYEDSTRYLVVHPSVYSTSMDSSFAERVLKILEYGEKLRNWTEKETPSCECSLTRQICNMTATYDSSPVMELLPDVDTLNKWITASSEEYVEKRYGGFSAAIKNNATNLVAWYNNKGHHAMPAYLNAVNNAVLRAVSGYSGANITVYSHPLKISKEQISKDTVYQHVADAGISGLVLIAYSLVSGGAAIYLVNARTAQEKRLQLLCGVSPALYWAQALAADMIIIVINMIISAIVFEAFGFPIFVARNNLPAICLLIFLYGYACSSFVHLVEKLFTEASMANMLLFCGNAFIGLAGITLLLILDIISDSDATDNARWVLHKVFMVFPQFVLGDGLLELAKNTIQALVLYRFGMDTYRDPLSTDLIAYHYMALVLVGTVLLALNLAIEYGYFDGVLLRFRSDQIMPPESVSEMEDLEVAAERKRVHMAISNAKDRPMMLPTIGNINAGFVDTEVKKNSIKRIISQPSDVVQCVGLGKAYRALGGYRVAVRSLTLGIPPGQCTALLGQNGAGKSTTFSMLTGEIRPTAGRIYLNEEPVDAWKLCKGLISYCPQSDAIDPLLTVRETLQFYCRLRGITEENEVIKRALDMFDLTKYADVQNGTLSGGNKRKLCTTIAFMGRTPLVLLDEPTSGMDPGSRGCVSRGVQIACANHRGVLLSTHALDDARRLAARVALLKDGQLRALASLDHCLQRFGGGYVVACRCRGPARPTWRRIKQAAAQASLKVLHHSAVHFLLPTSTTVDEKEVTTSLSDVFRLMAELQSTCDIEDYTVNQSSLDQMFLSFADKGEQEEPVDLEPLPSPLILRRNSGELDSITSL